MQCSMLFVWFCQQSGEWRQVMTTEECQLRAIECLEHAQKAREPQRQKLLQLAEEWVKLARESELIKNSESALSH